MNDLRRLHAVVSRAARRVLAHDCLNMAQSTAYSAIVALFPALMVAAAIVDLLPDTAPLRFQVALFFDRILPADVSLMLDAYFQNGPRNNHSVRALVGAGIVTAIGATNVMATIMEGLRRAYELPEHLWGFWARRRRAMMLVPLSLVPLAVASLLVVFGHSVTMWLAPAIFPGFRPAFYVMALLIRWTVALSASVGLIAVIYHLGIPGNAVSLPSGAQPVKRSWIKTLPGAIVATAMWFLTTLAFGYYVTGFANYSEVYGSLGAGIALLFWLYIISLSVLCGAEFNAQLHIQRHDLLLDGPRARFFARG